MKQNKHEYIYNISATLKEQQTDGRTDRSHGMQPSHLIPYHFWFLLRQWIFNLNLTNLASEWVSEWMTVCVSMDGVKWLGKWHEIAMPIALPSFYFIQQTFIIIIRRRMDGWLYNLVNCGTILVGWVVDDRPLICATLTNNLPLPAMYVIQFPQNVVRHTCDVHNQMAGLQRDVFCGHHVDIYFLLDYHLYG